MLTISGLEILIVRELSPWDGGYDVEGIARELADSYILLGRDAELRFGQIPEAEFQEIVRSHDFSVREA